MNIPVKITYLPFFFPAFSSAFLVRKLMEKNSSKNYVGTSKKFKNLNNDLCSCIFSSSLFTRFNAVSIYLNNFFTLKCSENNFLPQFKYLYDNFIIFMAPLLTQIVRRIDVSAVEKFYFLKNQNKFSSLFFCRFQVCQSPKFDLKSKRHLGLLTMLDLSLVIYYVCALHGGKVLECIS